MKMIFNLFVAILLLNSFSLSKADSCLNDEISTSPLGKCKKIIDFLDDENLNIKTENLIYLASSNEGKIEKNNYKLEIIKLNDTKLQSHNMRKSKLYIPESCLEQMESDTNIKLNRDKGIVIIISNYTEMNRNNISDKYFIIRHNSEGSTIKYINSKTFDLSFCSKDPILFDDEISIDDLRYNYTDNTTIDLDTILYGRKLGIDLFDPYSKFLNDICFKFTSEKGTDVTLDSRLEDYYQNITFCDDFENSHYTSYNYSEEKRTITYRCAFGFYQNEADRSGYLDLIDTELKSLVSVSNIKVITCYKQFLNLRDIIRNYGGMICILVLIIQIICFLLFCFIGIKPIEDKLEGLFILGTSILKRLSSMINIKTEQNNLIDGQPKKKFNLWGTIRKIIKKKKEERERQEKEKQEKQDNIGKEMITKEKLNLIETDISNSNPPNKRKSKIIEQDKDNKEPDNDEDKKEKDKHHHHHDKRKSIQSQRRKSKKRSDINNDNDNEDHHKEKDDKKEKHEHHHHDKRKSIQYEKEEKEDKKDKKHHHHDKRKSIQSHKRKSKNIEVENIDNEKEEKEDKKEKHEHHHHHDKKKSTRKSKNLEGENIDNVNEELNINKNNDKEDKKDKKHHHHDKRKSIQSQNKKSKNNEVENLPTQALKVEDVDSEKDLANDDNDNTKRENGEKKRTVKFAADKGDNNNKLIKKSVKDDNKKKEEDKLTEDDKATEKSKKTQIYEYENDELNELPFKRAVKYDKRSFCQYYWNILMFSHIILNVFFRHNDYNLFYVKLGLLFMTFPINITMNIFFYTNKSIKVSYVKSLDDISVFWDNIANSIYSSLLSSTLLIMLKLICLTHNSVRVLRKFKDLKYARDKSKCVLRCIKIRVTLYYLLSFAFVGTFGFYVLCFCAIFENTQKQLVKSTFTSWLISLIYPLVICLVTSLFRQLSFKFKNRILYAIKQILQFL